MCNSHFTEMTVLGLVELIIILKIKGAERAVGFCPPRACRFFEGVGWL